MKMKQKSRGDADVRWLTGWSILIGVFLLAGEGFNLARIYFESWLAYGNLSYVLIGTTGLLLSVGCLVFLGGFVYFRDLKRRRIRRS